MGMRLRLTADPQVRSCMNLLDGDRIGLLQVQVIDENQLMLCDQPERTPGAPLRGAMCKIANPLFEQGAVGIAVHGFGRREKSFEHDRTSVE
jgi:hypothetical protein